ncbi:zinc finger protein 62 homolog [Gigantopelta aegis]|uniref:zinc finger protein 62 homolog n=1 Tax=Gigantopelta aegis TaxID=1735272 RepID=UPI001B887F80|nr:zinc finger protein 62 homolog [Gigantopelta aegis]
MSAEMFRVRKSELQGIAEYSRAKAVEHDVPNILHHASLTITFKDACISEAFSTTSPYTCPAIQNLLSSEKMACSHCRFLQFRYMAHTLYTLVVNPSTSEVRIYTAGQSSSKVLNVCALEPFKIHKVITVGDREAADETRHCGTDTKNTSKVDCLTKIMSNAVDRCVERQVSQKPCEHNPGHSCEKRFQCGMCLKYFLHKSRIKQHMKIHTGERPYQCEVCRKCFRLHNSFKHHMFVHTGVKNFKCETVDKVRIRKQRYPRSSSKKEIDITEAPVQYFSSHYNCGDVSVNVHSSLVPGRLVRKQHSDLNQNYEGPLC